MKYERKKNSHQKRVVGIHLDILFYAVRATTPFQVSSIVECVAEISTECAKNYLKALVGLGYIEKVTTCKYQATEFAKEMFGVNVTNRDGEG